MPPPEGMQIQPWSDDRLVLLFHPSRAKSTTLRTLMFLVPALCALGAYPVTMAFRDGPKYAPWAGAFGLMMFLVLLLWLIYERFAMVRFEFGAETLRVIRTVGPLRWSQAFGRSDIAALRLVTTMDEGEFFVQLFVCDKRRRQVLWEANAESACPWLARIISDWSGAPILHSE